MIIHWLMLSAALALLLPPIAVFHGPHVRYRPAARDWDQHWRQILSLGLHSIDLGRGALGAWLLLLAVTRDPDAHGLLRHGSFLVHGAALALAILLQTLVSKERDGLHAPFTFVTGVLFGYFAPAVAGYAVLFALVISAGVRVPSLYFPLAAASLIAAGFLFTGKRVTIDLVVGATVTLLPWLAALLLRRPLMITYRSRRSDPIGSSGERSPTPTPFGSSSSAKR